MADKRLSTAAWWPAPIGGDGEKILRWMVRSCRKSSAWSDTGRGSEWEEHMKGALWWGNWKRGQHWKKSNWKNSSCLFWTEKYGIQKHLSKTKLFIIHCMTEVLAVLHCHSVAFNWGYPEIIRWKSVFPWLGSDHEEFGGGGRRWSIMEQNGNTNCFFSFFQFL